MLLKKLNGIDFILPIGFGYFLSMGGVAEEYGTDCLFSSDGFPVSAGVPQVRCSLPWSVQGPEVFLPGSVFLHGFRSAHIQGKPARHRSLPAGDAAEALPHGNPHKGLAEHARRRERESRLANVRRVRASSHRYRQASVCKRRLRHRLGRGGVRPRLHHHRPVPLPVSLGEISPDQGRHQTAHALESARQYSRIHPYFRRETARRQYSRRSHSAPPVVSM